MGKRGLPRCACGRSKSYDGERGRYPAGIQKEDLLWAYFVMRMICDVLGEPELMNKIQAPAPSNLMTPFDLAMLCCAFKNPGALQECVKAAKEAETKVDTKSEKKIESSVVTTKNTTVVEENKQVVGGKK